jgi:RNA polymerase sigma factor (sigma-70 family)
MTADEATERAHWVGQAVERFEGPLALYAKRLLGDPDRARDAVQETFLRLCRQERAAVDGHLRQWLFRVCRNLAMDEFRRLRMTPTNEAVIDGKPSRTPGPAQVAETREAASHVLRAVDDLPQREREVLHLRYQGGLSYKEIAAVTGHSLTYTGVLIHTAMKRLRGALTPALGLEGGAAGAVGRNR